MICSFFLAACLGKAQEQTAQLLQATATKLMQKGDFDNAVLMLQRASKQDPANISILQDLCYAAYLKRDYAQAIEVGKQLVDNPKSDAQAFQLLGLAYKAVAEYKDCEKLYRNGIRRFPKSGILYNEYAELFAMQNEMDDAIDQWEKGIAADPGYSSNYYNASIYYGKKQQWLRTALYAEIFLNLESYSARVADIKPMLLQAWKGLSNSAYLLKSAQEAKSPFEKAYAASLQQSIGGDAAPTSMSQITAIRTRFVIQWMNQYGAKYPVALFARQQYLLNQQLFAAYDYWLMSADDDDTYKQWKDAHAQEAQGFTDFQQSRVFKIPAGEAYFVKN